MVLPSPADDAAALEHSRIRAVLERYFHALDAGDGVDIAACFTTDAEVSYGGQGAAFTMTGSAAIAAQLVQTVGRFTASVHALSNTAIDIDGLSATADTFAVATVVVGGRALVRGLRYRDRLAKGAAGWQIAARSHTPLWQYDAATVAPYVPA